MAEQLVEIRGQEYVVLSRETETEGPRAGKADRLFLRKSKGRVVFMTWDRGPSFRARYEDPFKVGDDARTFFGAEGPKTGPALFPTQS